MKIKPEKSLIKTTKVYQCKNPTVPTLFTCNDFFVFWKHCPADDDRWGKDCLGSVQIPLHRIRSQQTRCFAQSLERGRLVSDSSGGGRRKGVGSNRSGIILSPSTSFSFDSLPTLSTVPTGRTSPTNVSTSSTDLTFHENGKWKTTTTTWGMSTNTRHVDPNYINCTLHSQSQNSQQ